MKKYCAIDVSKNNCYTCIHLDYYDAESESFNSSGYFCNGREYKSTSEENKHLEKLESQIYRARTKKCCERKDARSHNL